MKVENMRSTRSNREVANQFVICTRESQRGIDDNIAQMVDVEYFQSYKTVIVRKEYGPNHHIVLDHQWNCSRTTSKYRNEFLGETTKDTERKIKSGEYTLTNLNE